MRSVTNTFNTFRRLTRPAALSAVVGLAVCPVPVGAQSQTTPAGHMVTRRTDHPGEPAPLVTFAVGALGLGVLLWRARRRRKPPL